MSEIQKKSLPIVTHLYEIDLIRTLTVISVVALHTISYMKYLAVNPASLQWLYVAGHTLNYSRYMFMFATAFVLTYVYSHKNLEIKKFYSKRLLVVFIPYLLWSIIYIIFNRYPVSPDKFIFLTIDSIIYGTASFQLYYILITLQFYAIFPFFLRLLKKYTNHLFPILITFFFIQLAWMYYDFNYIQTGIHKIPDTFKELIKYRDRIFLEYIFFFVFGGVAALKWQLFKNYFNKYGKYIPFLLISTYVVYTIYFLAQLNIFNIPQYRASGSLQPSSTIFSTAMIIFLVFVSYLWSQRRIFHKAVQLISNTSFGIYFVHVIALSVTRTHILPLIPADLPLFFKILLVFLIAFGFSVMVSLFLLKIPFLSWAIGKTRSAGIDNKSK